MLIVLLLILGLACGSFVNALVWRIHKQATGKKTKDYSISRGRSMCVNCGHQLSSPDLIPILSWIFLKGKCRYCHKKISIQYPLVELLSATVFVASYLLWPKDFDNGQILLFVTWLISSVGLIALAVYDLRWMLLPNRIIYPTFFVAAAGRGLYIILYDLHPLKSLALWVVSVLIASGIFWLLFTLSQGKWIGFGDVRLGLITGTLLATPAKSLAMIFLASLIGTIIAMPGLLKGDKNTSSRMPYGPFLIIATGILVIWGDSFISWYSNLIVG